MHKGFSVFWCIVVLVGVLWSTAVYCGLSRYIVVYYSALSCIVGM